MPNKAEINLIENCLTTAAKASAKGEHDIAWAALLIRDLSQLWHKHFNLALSKNISPAKLLYHSTRACAPALASMISMTAKPDKVDKVADQTIELIRDELKALLTEARKQGIIQ
jgi:hypothetical protein